MASRGSTRLSQPHAGLIDVDKLDAGLFESGAHGIDRSLLQLLRRGRLRESRDNERVTAEHISQGSLFSTDFLQESIARVADWQLLTDAENRRHGR